MDPGAGVSRRSATRDGDGVEDDESEEMIQDDEQRVQRERPNRGAGRYITELQCVLDSKVSRN